MLRPGRNARGHRSPRDATPGLRSDDTVRRRAAQALTAVTAVWVVLAIGTPLLGTTVFAATDMLFAQPPWRDLVPTGFVPQNRYVGDTVDGVLPATYEFLDRLRSGDFPQWWPYNSGGMQLASVPNTALLSPVSLPYLLLPLEVAPGYVKLLEMVVAIGGTYLFLRRLGLVQAAAVLGGLVFASSGFMVAWTNWPQTRVAAFIPVLFWSIERIVQRRRLGDAGLLAAAVGSMLLGGFPAVTGFALVCAGLYCLVRLLMVEGCPARERIGLLALAAVGVVLGAGLAAMQLLPFVQELGAIATGDRTQNAGSHSPVESLILTIAADAFGGTSPDQVQWYGPSNPVEEMSYVGAAALVLLMVGVLARRRHGMPRGVRGFFVVAALVCVLLIFVGGPLLTALQQLPIFSDNRIGRARSLLGFFAAVLAGIGFDALLRGPAVATWSARRHQIWRLSGVAFVGCALVAGAVVTFLARRVSYTGQHPRAFEIALLVAALWGAASLVGVLVALRGRGLARVLGVLCIPLLVVAQSLTVVLPYWPRTPPEQLYPETATHTFLAANLGSDRIVTADAMMTGTEAVYGLRTTGGRGFIAENYSDLLRAACPDCFVSPTYVTGPKDPAAFDPEVLDRLATAYIVTDPAAPVPGVEEVIGAGVERVELLPGAELQIALPAGGLRGVGVLAVGSRADVSAWGRLRVVLRDASGTVLVDTERRLVKDADGGPVLAAVPEPAAAGATSATITLVDDAPLTVRGGGGVPSVVLVRPADDGVRVVDVGGATVYERLNALHRIRWATSSVVEPDERAAATLLMSGAAPEVVLSQPGPEPSGQPAGVNVVEDGGDTVQVEVDAEGGGFLVVADALQERWTARLDGAPTSLRNADVGVVAVWVPAGRHVVTLEYDPPAGGLGYAISIVALVILLALVAFDRWRRRALAPRPAASLEASSAPDGGRHFA